MDYSTEMSLIFNDCIFHNLLYPLGKGMKIYYRNRNSYFAKSAYNLQIYWLEYRQALLY